MLRVVGRLAHTCMSAGVAEPSGQASHKPRGRKPRNASTRFGKPNRLWKFECSRLCWRDEQIKPWGGDMADVAVTAPDFLGTHLTRHHVIAAHGKAVRSRRCLLESRRRMGTSIDVCIQMIGVQMLFKSCRQRSFPNSRRNLAAYPSRAVLVDARPSRPAGSRTTTGIYQSMARYFFPLCPLR